MEVALYVYLIVLAFGTMIALFEMAGNCPKESGRTDGDVFIHCFGVVLLWPLFVAVIILKSLVSGANSFIRNVLEG